MTNGTTSPGPRGAGSTSCLSTENRRTAPSNRPPQAWLLATPPEKTGWSVATAVNTVLNALEWATIRMVAPEDLDRYGHALPLAFAAGTVAGWPETEDDDEPETP